MKKLLLIASVFIYTASFSQGAKQIFESPNLKSLVYNAKKVAILPFNVSISYKNRGTGKISLDFYSREDLVRVLKILKKRS